MFLGGGFPESRMGELEANSALRAELRNAIETGLPVYALMAPMPFALSRGMTSVKRVFWSVQQL